MILPPATKKSSLAPMPLTQVDIDAGKVENQATASGLPTGGSTRVTGGSNDPITPEPNDKTVIEIPLAPAIALVEKCPNSQRYQ